MTPAAPAPREVAEPETVAEVSFDEAMEESIAALLRRYPTSRAALLPVLWLCQERWGWIAPGAAAAVARRLGLSHAEVAGVLTFYTMFETRPRGRYLLQVCSTLSCQLTGAGEVAERLARALGIDFGETTPDGLFTLVKVQCLGACGEGPVIQVNDAYFTEVAPDDVDGILDELRRAVS